MQIKLTPLNVVSAVCLVIAALLLFDKKAQQPGYVDITGLLIGFNLLTAVVAFVSDLIFRKFIPTLKKLWVVEGVLVIFIIILIFIIKTSIR